jgi:hypothetical protein
MLVLSTGAASNQLPNDGEDVGPGLSGDPLVRIGNRMQLAGQHIAGNDTSVRTQDIQVEIINDLSTLIEQTRRQYEANSASSQAAATSDRQEATRSQRPPEQQAENISANPARDSASNRGGGQSAQSGADLVDSFIKKTWGHLPPQFRQSVLNAGNEKFLPKYEMLIEQYYRRLAEDADRQP